MVVAAGGCVAAAIAAAHWIEMCLQMLPNAPSLAWNLARSPEAYVIETYVMGVLWVLVRRGPGQYTLAAPGVSSNSLTSTPVRMEKRRAYSLPLCTLKALGAEDIRQTSTRNQGT